MTRFTANFFSSGTRVLQKQGAHGCLGEPIVHLRVTGLADFHSSILVTDLFSFLVLIFCRCFGETEEKNQYEKGKCRCGYEDFAHGLPADSDLWIVSLLKLGCYQTTSKKRKIRNNSHNRGIPV